jgi:acetyl/propionyl-CoA carboxylase alpha subunit
MVGKLVTKGINRAVAVRKMRSALDGLFIEGLKTNIPLHKVIMNEENFVRGTYSTKYIEEVRPHEKVDTSFNFPKVCEKLASIESTKIWHQRNS